MTTLNEAIRTLELELYRFRNTIRTTSKNPTALLSLTGGVRCGRYRDDCDQSGEPASLPTNDVPFTQFLSNSFPTPANHPRLNDNDLEKGLAIKVACGDVLLNRHLLLPRRNDWI